MKGKYQKITLDRILDPEQPLRNDLTHESVKDLTNSIKQIGIINPLVVKEKGKGFELVAGHRRLVAAGCAGLTEAPCIVVKAEGMKGEIIKLQENIVRDEINPIEWAKHLAYIKKEYKLKDEKIAKLLGMSTTWVNQHLQILKYPPTLIEALESERLAFSSARELAQIKDPRKRDVYINHAIRGGLTPALAARWRKEANRQPLKQTGGTEGEEDTQPPDLDPEILTNCALCGEGIKPLDAVYLTVHTECQPKKPTPKKD